MPDDRRRRGRRQARQRRSAPDVFLCHRDAGGAVSPRRYRVAGVRHHQADRSRADPQQGRRRHRRCQPVAAGEGSGDPYPAQPAANAVADRRRSGRRRQLDAHLCRHDADADAAADGDPQHHRSRACQCHGGAGQDPDGCIGFVDPDAGDTLAGDHGATAGSRLHQAAGFCRDVAAGIDPWRRDSSQFRRRHRRNRPRQDHPRQARRPDAVVGQRGLRAGADRGPADFRRRRMAQKPERKLHCAGATR